MVNFWKGTSYRYEKIQGVQTNYIWGTQAVVADTAFEYLIEEDNNFELYAEQDAILQRHLDLGLDSF